MTRTGGLVACVSPPSSPCPAFLCLAYFVLPCYLKRVLGKGQGGFIRQGAGLDACGGAVRKHALPRVPCCESAGEDSRALGHV